MKKKLVVVCLVGTLALAGCSTAWLSTFEGYLQIAGPILIQILDIVSVAKGSPVNAQLVAKIQADQASVNTLAKSIQAASAQNVQGTCAQFNLAVNTFSTDLAAIEQLSNVGNSTTQSEINAAMQIAQQAITEVEAPIAACAVAPTQAKAMAELHAAAKGSTWTAEDCVRKFNAVVDAKHHVHLHSWPVRVLSFGHLQ